MPPQGFYPKPQQVFRARKGPNFRTKLIKVPACAVHNNARSKDDAYTQGLIVTMSALFKDDLDPETRPPFVDQWIKRINQGHRLRAWIDSGVPRETPWGEMVATTADAVAVARVLEATARGLYFHHHDGARRWPGRCDIQVPHFADRDLGHHPAAASLVEMNNAFGALHERAHPGGIKRGPHPAVFYYQLVEKDEEEVLLMRLVFFRAFVAFAMRPRKPQAPALQFTVNGPASSHTERSG